MYASKFARCAGFSSSPGVLRKTTAAYCFRSPSKASGLFVYVNVNACSLASFSRLSRATGMYS
jgi:hypothetical protein